MSWTISQVKNGGWRTDARFVEVAAYDGAVAERDTLRKLNKESCEMAIKAYEERDALQARLDEAEGLLRESTRWTRHDHGCPASYSNVCSCGLDNHRTARFNFSTLENGGA